MYDNLKRKVGDLLGIPVVNQKTIKELCATAPYSPDIIELERKRRATIFVADDMMRGGKLHEYISEVSVSGRFPTHAGYTQGEFVMWKKDLGEDSFPVALDEDVTGHRIGSATLEKAKIRGEVYSIRPRQFRKLDFLKENGVVFIRRRVNVIIPLYKVIYDKAHPLPHLADKNSVIEAWMYVGVHSYWDDQLAGVIPSNPVPIVEDNARPWLKKYYNHKNE